MRENEDEQRWQCQHLPTENSFTEKLVWRVAYSGDEPAENIWRRAPEAEESLNNGPQAGLRLGLWRKEED